MSIQRRSTRRGTVYDVRLRDPDGRPYKRTFRTRREAEQFEASQRVDQARGTWIDPRGAALRLDEWATHWLETDAAKSPGTRATDRSVLRSAILPTFGSRTLGSIAPADVQRVVADWAASCKARTVRRRYAVLAALFNAAVTADLIARSPCRGVKLPKVEPARGHILDAAELANLHAELPARYRPMATIGAILGLRFGEVAALRVGRIDLGRRVLHVEESLGEAGGHLFAKAPKTRAGRRTMPIPDALADELQRHFALCGLEGAAPDTLVFQGPAGGPLRRSHFRSRVWEPACRRAGLDGLGFHDLRRTNATWLVAGGTTIRDAQELLGHDDPRMLLGVYARATADGKRTAVERLSAALTAVPEPPRPSPAADGCAMDVPWNPRTAEEPITRQQRAIGSTRALPGGGEGNRTPGLNSAIVALYQLSYTPAGRRSG
jgi:integrase